MSIKWFPVWSTGCISKLNCYDCVNDWLPVISGHVCAFAYLQVKSLLVVNSVTASILNWDASVHLYWWRCCAIAAKEALTTPELTDWSLTLLHSWPVQCPNQDLFGLQTKKIYIKWERGKICIKRRKSVSIAAYGNWDRNENRMGPTIPITIIPG